MALDEAAQEMVVEEEEEKVPPVFTSRCPHLKVLTMRRVSFMHFIHNFMGFF